MNEKSVTFVQNEAPREWDVLELYQLFGPLKPDGDPECAKR
jgi:hypothetical protein